MGNIFGKVDEEDILWAVGSGDKKQVESLLSKNKKLVNVRGKLGITPLHVASVAGFRDIIELLIKNGSNINAVDDEGMTPLHSVLMANRPDMVEFLVSKGTDVEMKDRKGNTALMIAALRGYKEVVKFLIDAGVKLDVDVLHNAIWRDHADIVEILLTHGMNVNARDSENMTPLHSAAGRGSLRLVKLLLFKGAKVDALDGNGMTPLDVALMRNNVEVAEVLRKINEEELKKEKDNMIRAVTKFLDSDAEERDKIYCEHLKKLKAGYKNIDFTLMRYSYANTSFYSPYGDISGAIDGSCDRMKVKEEIMEAIEKEDWHGVIEKCKTVLDRNYLDIEAHLWCMMANRRLGNHKGEDHHSYIYYGLYRSILNSGDGRTPDTAFEVIDITEEYIVLDGMKDFTPERQSLNIINGHRYDVFDMKNKITGEKSKMYFNIDRLKKDG